MQNAIDSVVFHTDRKKPLYKRNVKMKQFLLFFLFIFLTGCVSSGGISNRYNPIENSVTVGNTVLHVNSDLKYVPSEIGSYKTGNIDDESGTDIERTYHIFVEKNEKINSGVCVLVQSLKNHQHYIRTALNYDHVKNFLKKGKIKIDNEVCPYFIAELKYIPKDIYKRISEQGLKFANQECIHVVYLRKQLGSSRWIDVIYAEGAENCTYYHGEAPNGYKAEEIEGVWNNFNKTVKIFHQ
jgi:hypothetical protein